MRCNSCVAEITPRSSLTADVLGSVSSCATVSGFESGPKASAVNGSSGAGSVLRSAAKKPSRPPVARATSNSVVWLHLMGVNRSCGGLLESPSRSWQGSDSSLHGRLLTLLALIDQRNHKSSRAGTVEGQASSEPTADSARLRNRIRDRAVWKRTVHRARCRVCTSIAAGQRSNEAGHGRNADASRKHLHTSIASGRRLTDLASLPR